ncbi:MAG TPA: RNA polymerase sigma factor [Saprospiraceae bacterium]|nr:RNA polymerase sigma factor [Saprospiraceae bacterium]HMQ83431.1 RNA polymerase sigma factor [Saprospiraceae bacterium]
MSTIEFNSAFDGLQKGLLNFAIHLTRDEEDARDLLQETAYKAFKYKNLYQPQTNLRAWLMTIMRNTFINNYRQKKRRQTLNDNTDNTYFINSSNIQVGNDGEASTTMEELIQLVENLDDWMKIPFVMHYEGYKYEEIAETLAIPLGTVKSRIFFARRRLQESLRQRYASTSLGQMLN